ncbi:hypothetical protein D3C78_243460 [compost metagenome]
MVLLSLYLFKIAIPQLGETDIIRFKAPLIDLFPMFTPDKLSGIASSSKYRKNV